MALRTPDDKRLIVKMAWDLYRDDRDNLSVETDTDVYLTFAALAYDHLFDNVPDPV